MQSFIEHLQEEADAKEVTKAELNQLEKYLDSIWKHLGIDVEFTKHFLDRVNDTRNKKQITIAELKKLFTDAFKKHGTKIRMMKGLESVLSDLNTHINVPFLVRFNPRSKDLELVNKTVMRKKGFRPNSSGEKLLQV